MRTRLLLAAALSIALTGPVLAECDDDTITSVSPSGDLITVESGDRYGINPEDREAAVLWQEGDDVLVCYTLYSTDKDDFFMIDKDQRSQRLKVAPDPAREREHEHDQARPRAEP